MKSEALTAWRERLGFNRSEAASRLGISRNAYTAYEEGKPGKNGKPRKIPLYIALACAAVAYGLPPMK